MSSPVFYFEILTSDGSRLADFYRDLLGWDIPTEGGFRQFSTGDGGAMGAIGEHDQPDKHWVSVYASVESVEDTLAKAAAAGAEIIVPRSEVAPGKFVGVFRDPLGNPMGLAEGW